MESYKQDYLDSLVELINNLPQLKNLFECSYSYKCVHSTIKETVELDTTSERLLELIIENSNDFTKDIANKVLKYKSNPSVKQSWCLAYQISNNKEVYIESLINLIKD